MFTARSAIRAFFFAVLFKVLVFSLIEHHNDLELDNDHKLADGLQLDDNL